ncbi:putative methyltransferase-domain-containing protein [Mycena amicta]|nr:putative methyltransferase-domain-containing protein [Mycena amicta]
MHPELFHVLRGYAALLTPHQLKFPSSLPLQLVHNFFLDHLLLDPHFQAYPPSEQYQKSFWKWAIPHLETKLTVDDSDFEIDSRIYEHYLVLLNTDTSGPPSQSYITHFWNPFADASISYQKTTLLESRTMIEAGTTGMRTWLASLVLAQYLILNPALVQQKRILELGSGIGFLGAIVSSLQLLHGSPGALWLSDVDETVLSRCQHNIRLPCNLSATHPNIRFSFLDWSAALDSERLASTTSLLQNDIAPDLVLGADIVFHPDLIPPLVATLRRALCSGSAATAIIAITVRNPTTRQKFVDILSNASDLIVETIDFHVQESIFVEHMEGSVDAVNIFKIQARVL